MYFNREARVRVRTLALRRLRDVTSSRGEESKTRRRGARKSEEVFQSSSNCSKETPKLAFAPVAHVWPTIAHRFRDDGFHRRNRRFRAQRKSSRWKN